MRGQGHSIKAFRATSKYKASIDTSIDAITNMDHYLEWVEGAKEAKVIKTFNEFKQACYYVNNLPMPLKDRDGVVIQEIVRIDSDNARIDISTMNELAEENKRYVRINQLEGGWLLKKLDDEFVELTYQVHLDPEGIIPNWVVNLMITDTPKKTLNNLHGLLLSRY